jgi:hypothetical protein
MQANPRTGLYEQTVRVFNPTYSTYDAVRVYVYGLSNTVQLYNRSGVTTDGVPYAESHQAVLPGTYVDMLLEYYVTGSGITPNPTLVPQLVPPSNGGSAVFFGIGQRINRGVVLANRNFMVEFASQPNRVYYVQYSRDLQTWKTAQPGITGNGSWMQWVDNGQPKTESAPATQAQRSYRIIMLP